MLVALDGLEAMFGTALTVVLHPPGRFPDTAMSVVIGEPLPCTAVAVNLQQLRTAQFEGAQHIGTVAPETMARVDQALRAVLDV
nr:hypothetical protein [Streptomyces sp. BA2]